MKCVHINIQAMITTGEHNNMELVENQTEMSHLFVLSWIQHNTANLQQPTLPLNWPASSQATNDLISGTNSIHIQ